MMKLNMISKLICKFFTHRLDYSKLLHLSITGRNKISDCDVKCLRCNENIELAYFQQQFKKIKTNKKSKYSVQELRVAMRKAEKNNNIHMGSNLFNIYL